MLCIGCMCGTQLHVLLLVIGQTSIVYDPCLRHCASDWQCQVPFPFSQAVVLLLCAPLLFPSGDLVHVVFGASKDFCGSGLRIGVLYSKNTSLNQALGNIGYFASVPGPLQYSLSKLWSDDEWLDGFMAENRRRMLEAYTTLAGVQGSAGYWRFLQDVINAARIGHCLCIYMPENVALSLGTTYTCSRRIPHLQVSRVLQCTARHARALQGDFDAAHKWPLLAHVMRQAECALHCRWTLVVVGTQVKRKHGGHFGTPSAAQEACAGTLLKASWMSS